MFSNTRELPATINENGEIPWRDLSSCPKRRDAMFLVKLQFPNGDFTWDVGWRDKDTGDITGPWRRKQPNGARLVPVAWLAGPSPAGVAAYAPGRVVKLRPAWGDDDGKPARDVIDGGGA